MPTNEAGLSGGQNQGDGGRTTASDTPGGEKNAGVGRDAQAAGQVATDEAEDADANGDPATATGPGD